MYTTLRRTTYILTILAVFTVATPEPFGATSRVKDIAFVDGAQDNFLLGYGLVVGLSGTGDGSGGLTSTSLANMMNVLGQRATANDVDPSNVAAVVVSAVLPPFYRPGSRIDVTVSTIGASKNLQGGNLVQTPLMGADQRVHAVAMGPVSIGGFRVEGGGGGGGSSVVQQNHPTVGVVANGAIVEGDEVIHDLLVGGYLRFNLFDPDFRTAHNMQESVNEALGQRAAQAINPAVIEIDVSQLADTEFANIVDLVAFLEGLPVTTDMPARIVLNENTGTVVAGEGIRIHPVAIAHGFLCISITETQEKQPVAGIGAGAQVTDAETTNVEITADVDPGGLFFVEGATVRELVDSLNQLGVNPRDLIAIFQALKRAGALKAELVTMPS